MLDFPIIDKAGHPNPPIFWMNIGWITQLDHYTVENMCEKREPWKKPVDTCAIGSINSQMFPIGDGKINPI